MRRRTPYAVKRLGDRVKIFGSEDTIHRLGDDSHPEASRVFVHTMGNEVLLTANGMIEVLTPDRAVSLARRLLNAAERASNVEEPK
jgi:hypothetical protein